MKKCLLVLFVLVSLSGCANKTAMTLGGAGGGAAGGAFVGSKIAGLPGAFVGAAGGAILGGTLGYFISNETQPSVQVPAKPDVK